ncbi:hypothetical protein C8Q70DRAFT_254079 [Cubamyces menziesii]|nr:hypothetical protein C8Q70DRAFT_254079 [Cubamyces menziesii]
MDVRRAPCAACGCGVSDRPLEALTGRCSNVFDSTHRRRYVPNPGLAHGRRIFANSDVVAQPRARPSYDSYPMGADVCSCSTYPVSSPPGSLVNDTAVSLSYILQEYLDGDKRRLQHVGIERRVQTQGPRTISSTNCPKLGFPWSGTSRARRLAHQRVDLRDPRPCEIKQIPLGVHRNEICLIAQARLGRDGDLGFYITRDCAVSQESGLQSLLNRGRLPTPIALLQASRCSAWTCEIPVLVIRSHFGHCAYTPPDPSNVEPSISGLASDGKLHAIH